MASLQSYQYSLILWPGDALQKESLYFYFFFAGGFNNNNDNEPSDILLPLQNIK
jgi:hypothetical protein